MSVILAAGAVYLGIGLIFAVGFAAAGAARLDPGARGAPLLFRVLIVPGAAALWPALAVKLLCQGRSHD